ncbi:MAG: hypothetical protein JWO36_1595 [Myxococcales bacterium]|nr:hypothetical protein [Myxococcales bacterium]
MRLFVSIALVLAACASPNVSSLRFTNAPAAQLVDDRRDIAKPETRVFARTLYMLDIFFARRLPRSLALEDTRRAGDVNALDEVPDSTWFTNRIGVRDLDDNEIRTAGRQGVSDPHGPWSVIGTKVGGQSPGFLVRDASGAKFVMKFDSRGAPDMQTGADVVVQKLLWAAGYNTPDDSIVTFHRDELTLGANAKVEDVFGNKHAMTVRDLENVLAEIDSRDDGSYRALVSRYLDGQPVGGYAAEGRRGDDPNDQVAHENRRALRGQRVLFAWLDHTDVKEDNGLDMWATDGGHHYLKHYVLDFGLALGTYGWDQTDPADGYAETVDLEYAGLSLMSLGMWKRPWEGADAPVIRGVGRLESSHFEPLEWRDRYPYVPFDRVEDSDGFWAAKLVMRFTERQIRAAVEQGRYEDPRAIDYLVRVLVERQRATGLAWFSRVSPLDAFSISGDGALCFDDLLLAQFPGLPPTRYVGKAYGYDGAVVNWTANVPGGAHACLPTLPAAADRDGYLIVELHAVRGNEQLPPVRVHVARDPQTRRLRVIGIRRR